MGQLTAGVAHDFNNLLTGIIGSLELLARRHAPDERSRHLVQTALGAAERGASLTAQLLAFARKQRLVPEPVDLNRAIGQIQGLLSSTLGGTVRVETRLATEPWCALVDPTQVELVILNLAINARDAMPDGGTLTIATANVTLGEPREPGAPPAGDYVRLSVEDTGVGMTEEVRARAFEPFFTTKPVGRGSGLGLSQVYGVARQSGGGVVIESAIGRGTAVTVYLPRAVDRVPASDPATGSPGSDGHGAILLVDDDAAVRAVTPTILEDLGYRVRDASGGAEALALLAAGEPVDLLLLDLAMPGMNGAEVARRAREIRPALPALFITGYADPAVLTGGVAQDRLISKPFRIAELAAKLDRALGS